MKCHWDVTNFRATSEALIIWQAIFVTKVWKKFAHGVIGCLSLQSQQEHQKSLDGWRQEVDAWEQ
jgi:hypothetical protein